MDFAEFLEWLDSYRVADVLLPFLLVFLIVFAVLQKTKILGEGKKNYNVMFALIMGLAVIFPHVLGVGPDVVPIINNALPHISLIAVAIVMFLFIIGIWGTKVKIAKTGLGTWVVILSILAVVYIFGAAAGWGWVIPSWLDWAVDSDVMAVFIIIIIFGIVINYITKEDKDTDADKGVFKRINKAFNDSLDESK